jgi:shikimate kinase
MILKLKRTPGIYLTGFMGSGKSTVGRLLADELGWSFVDLDNEIEQAAAMTIAQMFEQQGEISFRETESAALKKLTRMVGGGRPLVVALGGGAFLHTANFDLVSNHGVSIWLDCPWEIVERRVTGFTHRPLARDPQNLRQLFETRKQGYAQADYRVEIAGDDPAETVQQILKLGLL